MAFVPRDGTGRIFNNQIDKRKASQPDYTGTCNIGGQIFRVSAWHNPPSERNRVGSFSLRFKDKDEYDLEKRNSQVDTANKIHPNTDETAVQRKLGSHEHAQHDFDDDIPF